MSRGHDGVIRAARRLLSDATEFTENERAERNVESAIDLLDALEEETPAAEADGEAAVVAPGEDR
ncbi:hypothetical protein [Halosegnis marinus]|uniref:Uncharacterized protein n=1 Tax=Halosegnis marinus TaxID=3034023 RepID=A0ABD5ZLI2_9EURY|nr:hypothetical protein [Halosegnis sp. DT85]